MSAYVGLTKLQQASLGHLGMASDCGQSLAAVMSEDEKARRKAKLDETRPLTGKFEDYLTDVDVSSPCEQLPPDYQAHLNEEWWETVDQDLEYQEEHNASSNTR